MFIAIIVGIAIGLASFAPLIWGMNLARNATPTSNIGHAGGLLLGVFGSFAILAVSLVVCIVAFRDLTLPFVIAMAAALVVAAIGYGIKRQLR